ncbi:conjugal transfer protein TraD [Janthinobacterium sp. 17J80-10]|uniref:conjugal transfer protein TraD n=1 Tax=Janthinobacterium sp. 17J80-10 TaxID=2497863 RepID=UPI00100546A6|nr:conjugal transfer protein TraD [Janthinobacterium sp. 17J80-10]QAU35144.1 hypothetical protein EKL02_13685 [Janthinobacterium sp. 17J80-10]
MNRNSENYLHTQMALIKSLQNPSDQQLKLVDLGARYLQGHRLTTAELRAMEALILCEKSRCRAEAAAAKAAHALKNEKVQAHRIRTRRLIELGGLVELAQLGDWDKGLLIGAFTHMKLQCARDGWEKIAAMLKADGDQILESRSVAKTRQLKDQ